MKRLIAFVSLALWSCSESPRGLLDSTPTNNGGSVDMAVDPGVFQPMAPNIVSVSPRSLSTLGGNPITITGGPFYATTNFFINGQITQVQSVSSTQAVLVSPPRQRLGAATISAVNANGLTSSNSNAMGSRSALFFFASQVTFSQTAYPTQANRPRGAAFGDLNGDNILDVVVTHKDQGIYSVFLGSAGGVFGPLLPTTTFGTQGGQAANQTTALVDLNKDNRLDLLIGTDSNNFHYYLGNGTGRIDQVVNTNFGTSGQVFNQTTADINGDGLLDVITANINANNVGLFLNTNNNNSLYSGGQFQALSPGGQPTRVQAFDIDKDNKPDLVVSMQNNGGATLAVYFGTGSAATPFTAANPLNYGTNGNNQAPQWFELDDFNGDGKVDCLVSDVNTASLRMFLGNGTTANTFQAPSAPIAVGVEPRGMAVADFNGDGIDDVVVANRGSNNVSLLLGKGDGTFSSRQDYTSVNAPWAVYAYDFNNDGRMDFAAVNELNSAFGTSPGNLTIYMNSSL